MGQNFLNGSKFVRGPNSIYSTILEKNLRVSGKVGNSLFPGP